MIEGVKTIFDFIKEKGISIDEYAISFSIDDIDYVFGFEMRRKQDILCATRNGSEKKIECSMTQKDKKLDFIKCFHNKIKSIFENAE